MGQDRQRRPRRHERSRQPYLCDELELVVTAPWLKNIRRAALSDLGRDSEFEQQFRDGYESKIRQVQHRQIDLTCREETR